jgi:Protein of unknown function (DUF2844)
MKCLQGAIAVSAFAILLSTSCFAALGGDVNSVVADQAQMKAQRRVTQRTAYSIHEMQSQTGTTVREFVSPQGKVFGVAWQGQTLPNFQQVLGSYYEQFIRNAPRQRKHGPVTIEMPGLVVQSGGHMRALTGRAYVPEMIPSGTKVDEIR